MSSFRQPVLATLLLLFGLRGIFAQTSPTELIKAINTGDEKKARILLEHGADPNARDGMTPVIETAAYLGREKIVLMLLARGADCRAADQDGSNALHAAALGGH